MNTNQTIDVEFLLNSQSLQVKYIPSENTLYFSGYLKDSDAHLLNSLFRKIKKIIFFSKQIRLNLEKLESIPHSGIALFYHLVKIRLNEAVQFSFVTSDKMKWQHNWLNNIEKMSMSSGNQLHIYYQ